MFERVCVCVYLKMSLVVVRAKGQIEHEGAPLTLSQYSVCKCVRGLCVFVCLFESMSVSVNECDCILSLEMSNHLV